MNSITTILLLIGCSCHVFATVLSNATGHNATIKVNSPMPEQVRLIQYGVSLVETNFTSGQNCKSIVLRILLSQDGVSQLCQILCMARGALWESQSCNAHDYNLLMNRMCSNYTCQTSFPAVTTTQSPEEMRKLSENFKCVIDNQLSSNTCTLTVQDQVERKIVDPTQSCNILKQFHVAFPAFSCTTQDYNTLYTVTCDRQAVACSPLTSLINKLASSCRAMMNASASELIGPDACKYTESVKDSLLDRSICTYGDFAKVHFLVCHDNTSISQALTYGERVTHAENVIKTKLSTTCLGVVLPSFLKNTVDEFCQTIISVALSMVKRNVCHEADYTLLTTVVCISRPQSIIQDKELRRDFQELIATLSVKCKDAMLYFEKPTTDERVTDACKKLTKYSEDLVVTLTCSEREIIRISKLLCNTANTLTFTWLIYLATSVCLGNLQLFL